MVKKGESLHQCPEKDSDSDPGDIQIMNAHAMDVEEPSCFLQQNLESVQEKGFERTNFQAFVKDHKEAAPRWGDCTHPKWVW